MGEFGHCSKEPMWGRIKRKEASSPPELNRVPGPDNQDPSCVWLSTQLRKSPSCFLSPQMEHMFCLKFNVKTVSTVENDPPCMRRMMLVKMFFHKAHGNVAIDDRTLKWKLDGVRAL